MELAPFPPLPKKWQNTQKKGHVQKTGLKNTVCPQKSPKKDHSDKLA